MNLFHGLIRDCLIHTKHVDRAALLVAKSGSVMAVSSTFEESYENINTCLHQIRSPEAQMFTSAFKDLAATREHGFSFEEKVFSCVRADRNSIYCKCGGHGLILVRTSLFVIVATYNVSMSPSVCVEAVEKLAEYLREKGK